MRYPRFGINANLYQAFYATSMPVYPNYRNIFSAISPLPATTHFCLALPHKTHLYKNNYIAGNKMNIPKKASIIISFGKSVKLNS
jgi:hypothetical protein